MPRQPNRKKLRLLQALWYLKARKSGFKDIETRGGRLKSWTCAAEKMRKRYNTTQTEAKREYYRRAGFFLHSHSFATELERAIWELHCEGASCNLIFKELHKKFRYQSGDEETPYFKFKLNSVRRILSNLRRAMTEHFQNEPLEEWHSEGEAGSGN